MAPAEADSAHPPCDPAHGANVRFLEAHGLAGTGDQHDVRVAVSQRDADQVVALREVEGDQAGGALAGELGEGRLLHGAVGGGHEHEGVVRRRAGLAHGQQRRDAFVGVEREHVHERTALGPAAALRNLEHAQPVHLALVGEAEQRVVRVRDEEVLDEVLVLDGRRRLAAAPPPLRLVDVEGLRLGVALVRDRDHHVFLGDQVFGREVLVRALDLGAALVGVPVPHIGEFVADDAAQPVLRAEDLHQILDLVEDLAVVLHQLVTLQGGQALQLHVEDGLSLLLGESVGPLSEAELVAEVLGPAGVAAGPGHEFGDRFRGEPAGHQFGPGGGRGRRFADELDHFVDVLEGHRLALEQMPAAPRLAEQVQGPPDDHFAPVLEERLEHLLEVVELRLAVREGDAVDAEHRLELRLRVKVVEHDLAGVAAADLDDDPQAVLVRLVAQFRDALDLLVAGELGDLLDQARLVELVRDLGDDDRVLARLVGLDRGPCPHVDAAPTGAVRLHDPGASVDDAAGREVRAVDVFEQVVDGRVGIVEQEQASADDFRQVMGRDVRREADGDAGRTVQQEMRHAGRQHLRHRQRFVVVRDEVDRLLVEVGEEFVRDARHAHLGVAHRRGRIAVHGPEVALPVHEQVAHGEVLGHAHDGVVDGLIAVGVVLAHHVADHPRRLHVGPVPGVVHLAHRIEHALVDGLQAVPHVGQGAPDDHAHRIVEIRPLELVFDVDREDFTAAASAADRGGVGPGIGHGRL